MADDETEVVETETDSVDTSSEVETDSTETETTDAPEAGTDPVEAQPADEPEEYRKALEKVGGDKAKLASEYWQAKNAASALAKEKRQLEERLKALEGQPRQPLKPEVPPPPPQPHPDIEKLDKRIAAFESKGSEIEKSQRETLIALNEATVERQVLDRQLKAGGEFMAPEVKAELTAELRVAKLREQELLREFRAADERKELNQERLERAQQEKAFASKHLEGEKARQEQAERERETFFQEFPEQIDTHIKDICDELKVSEDKDVREFLWSGAYAHLVNLLSPYYGQGISADQVDFQAVLRDHIQRSAKVFDLVGRAAIGKLSTAKKAVTKPAGTPPPITSKPSNGDAPPVDWRDTPEMIARRERMMKLGI